jgi:hypothetical protein
MRSLTKITLTLFTASLLFISCKKESTGTSANSLGVKIQANNPSFSLLKSASATTPGFVWDSCFINVSKIEFEAERHENEMSHDSANIHFEWNGPKKVDLFSPSSLVGDISLQPGMYEEISVKIVALKTDAGSSPVFYLSGTYTNTAGLVIPIAVIVNEDFWFKIKKEGAGLSGTTDYTTLIHMNLSLLMSGIVISDLENATQTNGKIIISSTSNSSLYLKINTNLSTCEESEFNQGRESESRQGKGKD